MRYILFCLVIYFIPGHTLANVNPLWTTPVTPFRIANNLYYDHMGGAAEIIHETHAKNMVMDGDVSVVESGAHTDFLWPSPSIPAFAPSHVDRILYDGSIVSLGGITLIAYKTAGHTRGCTTWYMRSHIPGDREGIIRNIVIVGGTSF
jgi:metallo-beta-lactamase class B